MVNFYVFVPHPNNHRSASSVRPYRVHLTWALYNVDVTKPFPYRDNPRSLTLLACLSVGGSGQFEFMLAKPRPRSIRMRRAPMIWGNCELEDVAPVDIESGVRVNPSAGGATVKWDEGRMHGGHRRPFREVANSPGAMPSGAAPVAVLRR